jgi:hypothetical protein
METHSSDVNEVDPQDGYDTSNYWRFIYPR